MEAPNVICDAQAVVAALPTCLRELRTTHPRGLPLMVVLEIGPPAPLLTVAVQQFFGQLGGLLIPADRVWLLGTGPKPTAWSRPGYLNLEEPPDHVLAHTLGADLLVVAAADAERLAARLDAWAHRARLVIGALPEIVSPRPRAPTIVRFTLLRHPDGHEGAS
jgi:hypothetical protein